MGGRYPDGTSPTAAALAEALTELHKCFQSSTIAALSKRFGLSGASLSHYFNARRLPPAETLISMYEGAVQDLAKRGVLTMPFTLDYLLALRTAAKLGLCPNCHRALVGAPPLSVGDHEMDRRNDVSTDEDRHNVMNVPSPPPGLDEVLSYIESGRLQDASSVLWATASEVTAEEVAGAVSFFMHAGHPEAADVLLRGARGRGARDRLTIIRELLGLGLADAALVLLEG
ncbi:helix-turn-helix domain-containing protein [Amycolatopsis keratiniphila]|uniref:Uncharacterized protein n=1 Tax=Amycolatopsis keratiniphila subsp. keratiniphila TaxID=227715 RepID=A0A1W2LRD9_9PSEU|nr:helix-turn-helix transcriptional regulator [Amycolatopsis keratiniphila]ONF66908.1 hypothetical protein AVR91_0223435 [Amycolatopsis keratiniphila subsp. keratiniphila]